MAGRRPGERERPARILLRFDVDHVTTDVAADGEVVPSAEEKDLRTAGVGQHVGLLRQGI